MSVKYIGWSHYERGEQMQEVVGDTLSKCVNALAKKFACIPRHKEQLKEGGCVVRGNLKLWIQAVEDPEVARERQELYARILEANTPCREWRTWEEQPDDAARVTFSYSYDEEEQWNTAPIFTPTMAVSPTEEETPRS